MTVDTFIPGIVAAFFRLMPLLVLFPVPGVDRLPVFVRVFFCLGMAVALAGTLPATPALSAGLLTGHFLLGLALALGIHACFAGLHIGGHLIDTQAGTNAASIFNPAHSGSGIFSEFMILAVAVTVLLSDTVLLLLGQTMAVDPAHAADLFSPEAFPLFIAAIGNNMLAGFLLTFPIVAGLWLADVLAAASSRMLPQANIYFLFLPVKTLFATLLFVAYASLFLATADHVIANAMVM